MPPSKKSRAPRAKTAAPAATTVTVKTGDITTTKSELVVVDAFEGVERLGGVTAAVDEATGGLLSRVLAAGDFKGKFKETALVHPSDGPAKRVLLVGLGPVEKLTPDRVRRIAATVAKRARDLGVKEAHVVAPGVGRAQSRPQHGKPVDGGPHLDARVAGEAFAEGALLGLYRFDHYRGSPDSDAEPKKTLARLTLVEKDASHAKALRDGVKAGAIVAECTNMTRDWQAYSSGEAAPAEYGKRAQKLAKEHGLKVEVFDKKKIESLGMGGLLAVAQGSVREPRFVILEHKPAKPKGTVVLVGKGITFDSGGISIKPSANMEDMKMDKSGASAVAGAVLAAKRLDVPLHVVALMPFTDNLPSGSAYKPGDIVRTMSGKTIEIINTDAEGRVILSDALHYAGRYKPDACVELSTLTGGCPIAVGHHIIAGMGNSDELMLQLRQAGDATNERVWPLPFLDEYGEMVKSKVADVKNSAGRIASSITAGKFLEFFVGDHPFVHLDIAATAYHAGVTPRFNDEYSPEHQTGVGVRLLAAWMREFEKPAWKHKGEKPDSGKPKSKASRQDGTRAGKGPRRVATS